MIVKTQKPIKFINNCSCQVDYVELEKAIIWYSSKPTAQIKSIYLYGYYPAVSIYDHKIHIHRLLMMYWLNRDLENTEYVHHIDCDRLNCNKQNLKIMSPSAHQSLHRKGIKLSVEHRRNIGLANKNRKGMKYKKVYENPELLKD